jgi:3-oxoacyl-[acyl-carrier protein] reductase
MAQNKQTAFVQAEPLVKEKRLQDKVALVTGGGRGIGRAIALAFSANGANLALISRTTTELEQVAGEVRKLQGEAFVRRADVSKADEISQTVSEVLYHYKRIDILVNAAGVYGPIGLTAEADIQEWTRAMEVNLFGAFICSRLVLPHMMARKKGKIINMAGGGAASPLPRFTAYGVSKTAVVRLTETLAEELKELKIQVNAIAPGMVDTKIQDDVLAAGERAGDLFHRIQKLRETGEGGTSPQVAANLAVFLASEASDGLTGKLIAAPHDGWESWDAARIQELMSLPWFTLRRMDSFTLKPFIEKLK